MIPKRVFFTKGVGRHKDKLQSFELALRNAGIAQYNLVSVSSILPPECKIISKEKGIRMLKPGQVTFVVLARVETNEPNRLIAASIGLAVPSEAHYGYLSEHHCFGMTERKTGDYAEDLAASMLASTLGIEFNPDVAYDERKEIYKMSGKIIRTSSITQSALGDKNGLWTTVISAAVFIPPESVEEAKPELAKPEEVREIPEEQQTAETTGGAEESGNNHNS
ncbi:arginine decarboxylase, pyruvoyl-dependent [Candidatus Woesearchaeota archaeon]|nr:arginine decarboxylase, pyruvoyl-dependent [Candidatus Woesearchaeota archaeon]